MENSKFKTQKSKLQFKIKNFKFCIAILIFAFCILNFFGCARIKEAAKCVAGISTRVLEDTRKDAIRKQFNYDYNTCYNKTREALKDMKTYIYAQDTSKRMLAIYVSIEDTTAVGIFFKEMDATSTQIEVSSPSTSAREFIAHKLFKALNPEKEQGESDAKEEIENKGTY